MATLDLDRAVLCERLHDELDDLDIDELASVERILKAFARRRDILAGIGVDLPPRPDRAERARRVALRQFRKSTTYTAPRRPALRIIDGGDKS